jgi:hypothetical protein
MSSEGYVQGFEIDPDQSGFRLGGALNTVLLLLLLVVVASGVWGLALQQFLPTRVLRDVPAETIYSQIGHVSEQHRDEGARLVTAVCGPRPGDPVPGTEQRAGYAASGTHLVVGAAALGVPDRLTLPQFLRTRR